MPYLFYLLVYACFVPMRRKMFYAALFLSQLLLLLLGLLIMLAEKNLFGGNIPYLYSLFALSLDDLTLLHRTNIL